MTDGASRIGRSSAMRLVRLLALYCAQGIPYGFTTMFVPLQLAHRSDFTYSMGSLVQLAAFPWFLKIFWAPAADTRYSPTIGRRRSWILPAQSALAVTAFAGAAFVGTHAAPTTLFALVMFMSIFSSVQDVAVDGLAVDTLTEQERGLGNSVQVGGYKIGMLLGGSGLVYLASQTSASSSMLAFGAVVLALMSAAVLYREPPPPSRVESEVHGHGTRALLRVLATLRESSWLTTLAFIATLKIGESMVAAILKPFLVREMSFTDTRAAFAVGVVGGSISMIGSFAGGWAAGAFGRVRMLGIFGVLQSVALIVLALAVTQGVSEDLLIAAIGLQHLCVGLLTPVLYAYMMDVTDVDVAATHYSLLVTAELTAKSLGGVLSGPLTDAIGGTQLMWLAGTAGALPLLLLPWIRRPAPASALAVN